MEGIKRGKYGPDAVQMFTQKGKSYTAAARLLNIGLVVNRAIQKESH